MLMGYEVLRDLPLEDVEIGNTHHKDRSNNYVLAIVPILRAGNRDGRRPLNLFQQQSWTYRSTYRGEENPSTKAVNTW